MMDTVGVPDAGRGRRGATQRSQAEMLWVPSTRDRGDENAASGTSLSCHLRVLVTGQEGDNQRRKSRQSRRKKSGK